MAMDNSLRDRIFELALVGSLMALAIVVRLRGIGDQGLRFYDEGTYCRFGTTLLLGSGKTIFYKPGTAVLMWLAFKAFGHCDSAGLVLSALVGIATVVLAWWLVRRIAGRFAAAGTAAAFAAMPYMLFYHRSAMTEANYFFLALASLVFVVLGLGGSSAGGILPTMYWLAAGLCGGFGFTVNAPAALIYALVVLGGLVHLHVNRAGRRRMAMLLAANAVGFLCGWAVPQIITAPYVSETSVAMSAVHRLGNVVQFHPRLFWLKYLWGYAGWPVLVLAALGAYGLWKVRHPYRHLLTVLGAGLFGFYLQTGMSWPRIYFPLVLPVGLMAGLGVQYVLGRWIPRPMARWGVVIGLCGAMVGYGFEHSLPTLRLHSGYWDAQKFLVDGQAECVITAHNWGMFTAFIPAKLIYGGDQLARAFGPDADTNAPQGCFKWFVDNYGATHIVIDYFFWKLLSPSARQRFGEYIRSHPPDKTIPNPVAGDYETLAEDGEPSLSILDDPNARFIYIWRVGSPTR